MAGPFKPLSANARQILGIVRREAPISRAELARRTGLALPTVSRFIDQLLQDGIVAADDKVMMSRMGQPSLPLSLAPHAAYAFGVAVRADTLTVSLTHLSGAVVATIAEPHDGLTRSQTVKRVSRAITSLSAKGDIPTERVSGVGIALPGFFVDDPQRINAPLGMEDWATADLERELGGALGLPVLVENDGSAAALGEYLYGHGQSQPSFAYLYIDRGLGGGLVMEGKLVRGRRGNAGEFTGMLPPEARATRPTLTSLQACANAAGFHCSSFVDLVRDLDPASAYVREWVRQSTPSASAIISAIGAMFDPDAIVLGGRLPSNVAQRLIEKLSFYSVPVRGRDRAFPTLLASTLDGDAAALGASALCFQRCLL